MFARIALALVIVAAGGHVPLGPASTVSLVGVYPNPATDDDVGEYVLLHADSPTSLAGYALDDGEDVVPLPDRVVDGTVAVTDDTRIASVLANRPTVVVDEGLSLSNAGESVRLVHANRTVSSTTYDRAPEAEVWQDGTWTPLGATDWDTFGRSDVPVDAFALPDDPEIPIDALESADRRIRLAGYTLTSERVVDALVAAHRRGVDVRVLVEGGPVGGTPSTEIDALDRLSAAGILVVASGGPRARYDYHHPKYAVVDDRVLVTSENWKPSGTGGHASRGWGVVVRDDTVADRLARVFAGDAGWDDARPWSSLSKEGQPSRPANATFPTRFVPVRTRADSVRVVVAPDNAEPALRTLLASADESIRIEQVSVDRNGTLLPATVDAARRGVRVRILLSGEWYVEDENRRIVTALRRRAAREGLPIEARLVEPRSRFEHVHVKGVVVDERTTVVGSINWNRHALRENREVAVVVTDDDIGRYYTRLFRADWRGAAWRVHWTTLVGLGIAIAVAAWSVTRFDFDGREE